MAKLNLAPTKSSLLSIKRQLAFAEEGYDLLEQKRQILIFELMSRLRQADELERKVAGTLRLARAALDEATLEMGSVAMDRLTVAVKSESALQLTGQHWLGLMLPQVTIPSLTAGAPFGVAGASLSSDVARTRFVALLPLLAELATLQNAVARMARELRKTQRRCNALSKIFIPDYHETLIYIAGTLEERERESLSILKLIRNRLSDSSTHPRA